MGSFLRRHAIGLGVAVAAVAIRLVSLAPSFSLVKTLAYDDVAYFGSGQFLVAGRLPYRDFPFVQPPGVALVAAPFAWVGQWLGGDVGLGVMRVAMILMAAATCWLIADLLRPYGPVAAFAGSSLYAFHGLVVLTSRTFYLEPFLVFAVVATFWSISRIPDRRRWWVATGVLLGIACTIKIWALVDVAFFAVLLLTTRGRRRTLAWLTGVAATIVVVVLPFFALAPRELLDQVVLSQLGRGGGESMLVRLTSFDTFVGFPGVSWRLSSTVAAVLVALFLVAASTPLVAAAVRRRAPREWGPAAWWASLALIEGVVLAVAPVFYGHYLVWPSGPLALAIGGVVGRLDRPSTRIPLSVVVAIAIVLLTLMPYRWSYSLQGDIEVVRRFASTQRCTWFDAMVLQGAVASRDVPLGVWCRPWPDPVGAVIVYGGAKTADPGRSAAATPKWQEQTRRQLLGADSAITCVALDSEPWDATTRALFESRFVPYDPPWRSATACNWWLLAPGVSG